MCLALAVQCCLAKELLVLLGNADLRDSHSTFLADLKDAGFGLDVKEITDSTLRLQRWDRWLYDGVVIVAGKSGELGGALDAPYLVELVDSGRSLFIATDEHANPAIREAASELGTDLLEAGATATDHISHSVEHGPAALLTDVLRVPAIVGESRDPILVRGTAATVTHKSVLTTAVLAPRATAAAGVGGGKPRLLGPSLALATALQTRAGARFFCLASVDALSNAFYTARVRDSSTGAAAARTGNRALGRETALWTFQEKGVLRLENFRHARSADRAPPPLDTYTINDDITVELDLLEQRGAEWQPHITDALQAEFVMLDPYIRQAMNHTGGGHYALRARAPDKYGVFKWVIDYGAPGYSAVHVSAVTPLRPLRHSEYPRFVLQAYPYYAALLAVSVAFLVMITFVMYHE
jgi:oligosaccharyltransferase complex subunit beta